MPKCKFPDLTSVANKVIAIIEENEYVVFDAITQDTFIFKTGKRFVEWNNKIHERMHEKIKSTKEAMTFTPASLFASLLTEEFEGEKKFGRKTRETLKEMLETVFAITLSIKPLPKASSGVEMYA